MSITDLDPVIHAPKRLAAMALLSTASSASFQFLKDHLGIADSDLSKQMSALEAAGFVSATKHGRGRGGSTTYRLTRSGRAAYRAHRAALQALLAAEPADSEEWRASGSAPIAATGAGAHSQAPKPRP